jgi:selenoprotein W-related protein
MTSVEVEYCDPCGFIDRATETQTQILESCGDALDGVELVPGEEGIFEVRVDDVVVFDIDEIEYDLATIMEGVCGELAGCDCNPAEIVGTGTDSGGASTDCC